MQLVWARGRHIESHAVTTEHRLADAIATIQDMDLFSRCGNLGRRRVHYVGRCEEARPVHHPRIDRHRSLLRESMGRGCEWPVCKVVNSCWKQRCSGALALAGRAYRGRGIRSLSTAWLHRLDGVLRCAFWDVKVGMLEILGRIATTVTAKSRVTGKFLKIGHR